MAFKNDITARKAGQGAAELAAQLAAEAPIRTAFARILRVHTDERAWRRGAKGEVEVGRRLSHLPACWSVIHDLPIDGAEANIDHIVLGPPGVFTINAKNLNGKVWVGDHALLHNGTKTDFYRKARWEAAWAARQLTTASNRPVGVMPLIVVMGAEVTVKSQPLDIEVVTRRRILSWLKSCPPQLNAGELRELDGIIKSASTWRPVDDKRNLPPGL